MTGKMKWMWGITVFLLIALLGALIYTNTIGRQPAYDSSAVFQKIETLQEVSLIKYHYTGVAGMKDSRSIGSVDIPLTQKHFLVKFNGTIKAGIDFDSIRVEAKGRTLRLQLPKARIIENAVDEKSIVVYDESLNFLNPIRIGDFTAVILTEKTNIQEAALRDGILEQADRQAELMLRTFGQGLGFEEVEISR